MDIQDKIKMKQVEELTPYVNNPKEHPPEQIEKIASSIKEFGFTVPIVIDGDDTIIMGHGRIQASKKLDLDEVPVIVRDDLTEAQVKALRIADNKVAESGWEDESLESELMALDEFDFDMELTGFDEDEVVDILDPELEDVEEEPVPEEPEEPTTNKGDLWILGDHRLLCGDATDESDVERLMDGEKADMVFTDPPWGVDYDGGTKEREKLEGDKNTSLYNPTCKIAYEYTVDEAPFYLMYAGTLSEKVFKSVRENDWAVRNVLVWNKNQAQFGALSAQYKEKKEPILYCHKKGEAPNWYGPNNEVTVWDIDRNNKSEHHPTENPTKVPMRAISNSTLANDIVIDLYGGSGSTLMACEQSNRFAFTMELESNYCDVIVERWENLTGKEAERITNE